MAQFTPTTFEVAWGGDLHAEQKRYFHVDRFNDAVVRFAEHVIDLDRDAAVGGAYATLKRLPDSIYPDGQTLAFWTKTSNERPTADGAIEPPLA